MREISNIFSFNSTYSPVGYDAITYRTDSEELIICDAVDEQTNF